MKANFPAEEVGNAMAIADAESGQQNVAGAPNADGSRDWGLFQLNDGAEGNGGSLQSALDGIGVGYKDERQAQELALKPGINVKAAAWMYRTRGGWGPWTAAAQLGIVKELYSNEHGPNYGKFTAVGDPSKSLADGSHPGDPKPTESPKPTKPPKPTKSPKPTKPAGPGPAQPPQQPVPQPEPQPTTEPSPANPSESPSGAESS